MRKLVIISYWYFPNQQAPSFRVDAYLKHLSPYFDKTILITRNFENQKTDWKEISRFQNNKVEVEKSETVEIHRLPFKKTFIKSIFSVFINSKIPFVKRIALGKYYFFFGKSFYHDMENDFKNYLLDTKILEGENTFVLTTSPPEWLIFMTAHLKKQIPFFWIVDLRDDISGVFARIKRGFLYEFIRKRNDEKVKKCISQSNLILSVSEEYTNKLADYYKIESRFSVANGFSDDLIAMKHQGNEIKTIVYTGAFYSIQDSENQFLNALSQLEKNTKSLHTQLQVIFIGSDLYNNEASNRLKLYPNLQKVVRVLPWQNRDELLVIYEKASLFLHFTYNGKAEIPSTKLYEYFACKKKVLLINPDNGFMETELKKYNRLITFQNTEYIIDFLEDFIQNKVETIVVENEETTFSFSRKSEVQKLGEYIKNKFF